MIRFYKGLLGQEEFYCKEDVDNYCYTEPQIGDMIELPPSNNTENFDSDVWVIKQRLIEPDGISCFCELYDWED